jgi:3-deoxy-D-manno-octulosonate 8-phosphate phosphatase (KDO 8-P phosphatase)
MIAFDIDGTLTDATTTWLGPETGWTQTYSTRDGEALLRAQRAGLHTVPISRNKTQAARIRMELLRMPLEWLGLADKVAALEEVLARYGVAPNEVLFIGDGPEDADLFRRVGFGCAVADAHPDALAAAHYVTLRPGGGRAMEEVVEMVLAAQTEERA